MRYWHRSTAGSPRALTRLTSRKPRHCWRSWGHKMAAQTGATHTQGPKIHLDAGRGLSVSRNAQGHDLCMPRPAMLEITHEYTCTTEDHSMAEGVFTVRT